MFMFALIVCGGISLVEAVDNLHKPNVTFNNCVTWSARADVVFLQYVFTSISMGADIQQHK